MLTAQKIVEKTLHEYIWFNGMKVNNKLDLESIKSSLRMDFEKEGISLRIDCD